MDVGKNGFSALGEGEAFSIAANDFAMQTFLYQNVVYSIW